MPNTDWNQPLCSLAEHYDALVIGAGPAGSACARLLAQAGRRVALVEAQCFPRDKVCGDGLVPDAHDALRRLGVHAEVMALARPVTAARCVAPNGGFVDVTGELAVLSRRVLDAVLCRAAVQAGATMAAPVRFVAPMIDAAGRVCGATLSDGTLQREIAADWVVLATGALPTALLATGLCRRRSPSGMALRTHVHHAGMEHELSEMRFVWHRQLQGGYGWIFPGPGGVFNLGVGLLDSREQPAESSRPWRRKGPNLREMFDIFLGIDPMAARLMREGQVLSELKGAPLRCDLAGADWSRPGLLVTGEAAGATYSFTGEGIGKAMETAMAAADALLGQAGASASTSTSAAGQPPSDAAVAADYRARLQVLLPRFQTYRQAASFNRWPWLVSLIIWRAHQSPRLKAKFSDILNERRLPGSLLTLRGLRNLLRP